MSTASTVAAAIDARLAEITVAGGYLTNIGAKRFRGRRALPKDAPPCVVLVEGDDIVRGEQGPHVKLDQVYILEGWVACDPDNPNDAAHEVLADLKRAIFSGDRTFGRLVRELHYRGRTIGVRPDGSAVVSANIEIAVEFAENLADP